MASASQILNCFGSKPTPSFYCWIYLHPSWWPAAGHYRFSERLGSAPYSLRYCLELSLKHPCVNHMILTSHGFGATP